MNEVPGSRYAAGLCSASFRNRDVEAIIALALESRLCGIEWSSETHAPVGDWKAAANIRRLCERAGVRPASYGTYLRAGEGNERSYLAAIVDTAWTLGVANIRIWGGPRGIGSAAAGAQVFAAAVAEIRWICDLAAARGLKISLEFHADTLVDTGPAADRLLQVVSHEALFTYWQPTPGVTLQTAQEELALLAPRLSHMHVFSRDKERRRHPLSSAGAFWTQLLAHVKPSAAWLSPAFAMIEFVKDDDPAYLSLDAAFLHSVIG